jgi:hypothetical protein
MRYRFGRKGFMLVQTHVFGVVILFVIFSGCYFIAFHFVHFFWFNLSVYMKTCLVALKQLFEDMDNGKQFVVSVFASLLFVFSFFF